MKPIASAADQLAFQMAIGQAEARLKSGELPAKAPERAPEAQAPEASQRVRGTLQERGRASSGVEELRSRRARQKADEAAQFARLARKLGMDLAAAEDLAAAYLADTHSAWTFVMISPAQNAAVVRWISENSKRPQAAILLWAHLFEVMRNDTGEILRNREELAERVGVDRDNLSRIMTELASINAVRREKQGREVRYFMNSTIATHLPSAEARAKAREADGPVLTVVQGGQSKS